MIQKLQRHLERSAVIIEQDQLRPFQATRLDTGQSVWLVQSRSTPDRHYLLTVEGQDIRCPCPHAQQRGVCAHTAAVRLALQDQQQKRLSANNPQSSQPAPQPTSGVYPHPEPRTEQERHQREATERRERALLWTDDRPFSIWKS